MCIYKYKKYFIFIIFLFVFINIFCCNFNYVDAGILSPEVTDNLFIQEGELITEAGFEPNTEVGDVMSMVIKAFLSLLGIIFVILIITAGYQWMTAEGDEQKVNEAKDKIKRAIIGLIIIVSAYAITHFVFARLPGGSGSGGVGGGVGGGSGG